MLVDNTFIVLVNWNLEQDTIACIDSLLGAGVPENHIILVDNGSVDNSVKGIKARYAGKIQLIENDSNLGYAPASNQGIELALSQDAKWIFLLNNDTIVAEDLFEDLSKHASAEGSFALLSPMIYYFDKPETIWYAGDRLIPGTLITRRKFAGKENHPQLPEFYPVHFLSGCAMLVRRDVFEIIGMFDPDYVMYGEEIDFCWRAQQAGYRLACITSGSIWHKVSRSADRVKPQTRYLRIRNQVRFYRKYSQGLQLPLMVIFSFVRALVLGVGDIIARRSELIPPLARGWIDGWLNS